MGLVVFVGGGCVGGGLVSVGGFRVGVSVGLTLGFEVFVGVEVK